MADQQPLSSTMCSCLSLHCHCHCQVPCQLNTEQPCLTTMPRGCLRNQRCERTDGSISWLRPWRQWRHCDDIRGTFELNSHCHYRNNVWVFSTLLKYRTNITYYNTEGWSVCWFVRGLGRGGGSDTWRLIITDVVFTVQIICHMSISTLRKKSHAKQNICVYIFDSFRNLLLAHEGILVCHLTNQLNCFCGFTSSSVKNIEQD